MIIVMASDATPEEVEKVENTVRELGYTPHEIVGVERKVIGAVGDEGGKNRLQSLQQDYVCGGGKSHRACDHLIPIGKILHCQRQVQSCRARIQSDRMLATYVVFK